VFHCRYALIVVFLDREIPTEFKVALQQARTAKGWTQKQLAQRINEKQTVINEYETGRVIPNPQIIQKLQRALGVSLPKIPKKKKVEEDD
jgi:putative transcription factor